MTVTEIGRPATDDDAAGGDAAAPRAGRRLPAHRALSDDGPDLQPHLGPPPGPEHRFLLNPFGLLYEEVTASNLVIVGLDGQLVTDGPWKVNPAGFVIHSAIHEAREDALCVLHTHTKAGCAVAAQEHGLLPLNQMSLEFYDRVAYHDYEGIALSNAEKTRLVADLGSKPVMILRNHGLLTVGKTPARRSCACSTSSAPARSRSTRCGRRADHHPAAGGLRVHRPPVRGQPGPRRLQQRRRAQPGLGRHAPPGRAPVPGLQGLTAISERHGGRVVLVSRAQDEDILLRFRAAFTRRSSPSRGRAATPTTWATPTRSRPTPTSSAWPSAARPGDRRRTSPRCRAAHRRRGGGRL